MRKKRDALATIPTDINKIYDKAIERIRRQIGSRRELALRVLSWIKYALWPLKIKELQEAVAIEDGDKFMDDESLTSVDTIIEICAGLVTVDYASGTIRLLHFTLEQYLSGRLDIFQRLYHPQFYLADICLTYLAFEWRSTDLNDPLEPSSSVSVFIESNALLWYAVKNSHRHWDFYLSGARNLGRPVLLSKLEEIIGNDRRRRKIFQIFFSDGEWEPHRQWPFSCLSFGKGHAVSAWGLDDLLRKYLLDDDFDLNALDEHGRTPLSFAVEYGWIEVTDILLAFPEININAADDRRRTATWWGANTRSEQALRLLLETPGIQPNRMDATGKTPLIRAATAGADGCLRALLDCPSVDPNSKDPNGRTSLYLACMLGKKATVKILLDNDGADVDARDLVYRTPLHAACERGDANVVKMLLERHADVNCQDISGITPLQVAVREGDKNLTVIKLLLDADGIDATRKCALGLTPLSDAISSHHDQITKVLIEWERHLVSRQSATN